MMPNWCFIDVYFSIRKSILKVYHRVVLGTSNLSRSSEYLDFAIILLSQDTHCYPSVYNCIFGDVIHILYLTYIYMLLILGFYQMSVSFVWMDSKAITTSIIFLFGTWYLGLATREMDIPWTTNISALKIYWFLMLMMIWNWNEIVIQRGE